MCIRDRDTAVLALGYWPDPVIGETTPGLETHKYGLILADPVSYTHLTLPTSYSV